MTSTPIQPHDFTFSSADGIHQIHAVVWHPTQGNPKGVVQLVHGISEYIGRYTHFATFLAQQGYLVVGHDHLGHGQTAHSPDEYGFFTQENGWDYLLQDVDTLQRQIAGQFPHLPYILMGHSMGSFVVRCYIATYPRHLAGCILSGTGQEATPLIKCALGLSALLGRTKGKACRSTLLTNLSTGAYNGHFKPNRTTADWISRDEALVDAYLKDELCRFYPTIGMYHDMFSGLSFLSKKSNLKDIDPALPIYLFSGEKDPVGGNGAGVRRVYQMLKDCGVGSVTMKLYPQGRHEMLNEINKEEVYQDLLQWLERL